MPDQLRIISDSSGPLVTSGVRRRSARRGFVGVAVVAGLVAMCTLPASAAADPMAAAQSALQRATDARVEADSHVADVQSRLAAVESNLSDLGNQDAELTEELATARHALREFAVAAYIDGGQSEILRSSLSPEQAQALSWQSNLSLGQSTSASEAADRFRVLKEANDPARLEAAEQLDRLEVEAEAARFDAIQAAAHERDAEAALAEARAAAERAAQARAAQEQAAKDRAANDRAAQAASAAAAADAPSPSAAQAPRQRSAPGSSTPAPAAPAPSSPAPSSPAPSGGAGNPSAAESATLAKIRRCESRGNYAIVSASGRYRGAYQFDFSTWRSMGGSGDPAAASPSEQDYRALLLLRLRGTRPWPHCGR